MAFTYDTSLATAKDRVRFAIGDTYTPHHLFEDAEITAILTNNSDDEGVAAYKLADHLAARFAREADFAMDEQSVKLSQKSAQYSKIAARLREDSADGGLSTIVLTKIDGYQPTNAEKDAFDRVNYRNEDFDAGRFAG